MGNQSRRKGLRGEQEVARAFRGAGYEVKALEYGGDWLCIHGANIHVPPLHVEVKRAEQLKMKEWLRQAAAEAVPSHVPVVVFRQSGEPWRVVVTLEDFIGVLG